MSDYIKKIRTTTGDKQIDYTALANLPDLTVDSTLSRSGKAADAKVIGDKIKAIETQLDSSNRVFANAIVQTKQGKEIALNDSDNLPFQNIKVFGKSTQDGTPTPNAPVNIVNIENPMMMVHGKNLVDLHCNSGVDNYVALVNAEDLRDIKKGHQYTLSVYLHATGATRAYWNNATRLYGYLEFDVAAGTNRYTYSFIAQEDGALYETVSNVVNKYPMDDEVVITASNAQLEIGNVATEYEPYLGETLSLTHNLRGIPVDSGGNYTDENGQQWICDEVDFKRGVHVQRLASYVFDGSTDEKWEFQDSFNGAYMISDLLRGSSQYATPMCCNYAMRRSWGDGSKDTHFCFINGYDDFVIGGSEITVQYSNVGAWKAQLSILPCVVVYQLASPIETPLSETEINTYRALHTNSPSTTIVNDAGAWIEVSYNADASVVIKKLTDAIVALGGTV